MIRLHYAPGNASLAPHLLLLELGRPFELVLVDRERNEQRSPAYLKLNPNGLIPVLTDGDLVLYETAAILLHLADSHPQAGLLPPLGSAARAEAYKWLCWLSSGLQVTMGRYFYPERQLPPEFPEAIALLREQAEARAGELLDILDAEFARHGGPWVLGAQYSAVDPLAFMMCRWTRGMRRPARSLPHLGPYVQRMLERPATQSLWAAEGLQAPYV
ncbi:glutathione S-transferase family protein [Pelomonas sp. APW6]|uniref:Glutathione S-transferase family protein n=1 Tax=Roseateles subflavus TaxID=3053353 RepID=A0ABT7LC94_9BURK|nr:glutathione S-transferase family protein [Pelomonas sp. APW6]MDL5030485.1 glutathione S-transferase family protein [Pelomonas sp. APW6]